MKPASSKRASISLAAVQGASSEPVFRRGVQYYRRKKVLKYVENPNGHIEALIIGSEPQPYKVVVTPDENGGFKAECSCPYFEEVCKHSVAVLLTHVARANPGIRFDTGDAERARDGGNERLPKAKELLDDPRALKETDGTSGRSGAADTTGATDTTGASGISRPTATAGATNAAGAPEPRDFTLGLLVLERPLALILGTIPNEPQGKVNILKVPAEVLQVLEPESRIYRLAKYLTSLPQTTKGPAGGHRIPRGEEGYVIGHLSLCTRLVNTANGAEILFSPVNPKPRVALSETESGELLLRLEAILPGGDKLNHPVFFLGQSSWILSENVFYNIDLSAIHRLFQFFDSYGQMTVKLEIVPKFLAVDLPILTKRMDVQFDEKSAPFPIAITEPPQVVIRLAEKRSGSSPTGSTGSSPQAPSAQSHLAPAQYVPAQSAQTQLPQTQLPQTQLPQVPLEVSLGFRYGDLILPSRDETSAFESELYTRSISEQGQSVWVKRVWDQESQVRRFLSNLQPQRTIADRFFFTEEPALDAVYYLSSEQCASWEVVGKENLMHYRVRQDGLKLKAQLSLIQNSFKFDFALRCFSQLEEIPFNQLLEALFRNRNYVRLENYVRPEREQEQDANYIAEHASETAAEPVSAQIAGGVTENPTNAPVYVRLAAPTLLSLLKAIGQSRETSRPLYQSLAIMNALESHQVEVESDEGFSAFLHKMYNFKSLPPLKINENFHGELREYQQEGCNWLSFLREYGLAGILADDMGLGKTIQALAMLLTHHSSEKRAPSLVVAPTSVVYNWLSEAEKFTPNLRTALLLGRDRSELMNCLLRGNGKDRDKDKDKGGEDKSRDDRTPDVIFTTYGIIRRDYEALKNIQFEYLILDEAQNIKNPDSVGAIGCKSLKAYQRIALSGTPVENRLKELWSLFDFLMPEFLGRYKDFNETFERPIEAGLNGAGQKLRKIINPFILRRLKSQVEKELPDRTDIVNLCELEDEQRSLYLDVLDECRQKVFSEIASRGIGRSQLSVLTALLRLRQVCCDPRLLKNREVPNTAAASAKLTALIAMIGEIVDEGHKILVFSQFVEMLALIETELQTAGYTYEYIDGQTPAKERLERVNRFNADDSIPIFLISLKAGGTGLNLTGADYVIHYDPWWNPAVENQATDRAHRIGQTRHVFNYKLITRGTVEEKIIALQKKKKELAELIIGGDESAAKELTKEDLEFLFSF